MAPEIEQVVEADDQEQHIGRLRLAEHQFRLACTVNLAVTNRVQTLDVPVEWTFGRHRVGYAEFGLRQDQADLASCQLEMTATCVLAGAIRDAIVGTFKHPKTHDNADVVSAYQISRLIRNAFSHSMVSPRWSIDQDCKNREFGIDGVISLNTALLHEKWLDWHDYGGPLAIFRFGRFVRERLLGASIDPDRRTPSFPTMECYQQGRLILRRVDQIPAGATLAQTAGPGETIDLGDGHIVRVPL
jgi:hypothetical protein